MGQKVNIVTLRKSEKNLNLFRNNSNEFLYGFFFLQLMQKLLNIHKVFLTSFIFNFVENKIYINFFFFFRVAKLLKFKKLKLISYPILINGINFFFNQLCFFKKNLVIFRFLNLNVKLVKKKKMIFSFFRNFKRYALVLFPRRFHFFLDFLKISVLFSSGLVNSKFFIKILVEMFRILQKKRHSRFFTFIRYFFTFLINKDVAREYKIVNRIKGIKFILSGKLKGKARSNHYNLILGKIPIQSLNKQIEFAKAHAFTVYGVFGLKLWVYRSISI